jgi:hypothetical protein
LRHAGLGGIRTLSRPKEQVASADRALSLLTTPYRRGTVEDVPKGVACLEQVPSMTTSRNTERFLALSERFAQVSVVGEITSQYTVLVCELRREGGSRSEMGEL